MLYPWSNNQQKLSTHHQLRQSMLLLNQLILSMKSSGSIVQRRRVWVNWSSRKVRTFSRLSSWSWMVYSPTIALLLSKEVSSIHSSLVSEITFPTARSSASTLLKKTTISRTSTDYLNVSMMLKTATRNVIKWYRGWASSSHIWEHIHKKGLTNVTTRTATQHSANRAILKSTLNPTKA